MTVILVEQIQFYNLNNLQGSQTSFVTFLLVWVFYNLNNLQGSQTSLTGRIGCEQFYNLNNLQGSQTSPLSCIR